MLTRIRIEVSDEDSAAATEQALDRYEAALHTQEAFRFGFIAPEPWEWGKLRAADQKILASEDLGREVSDEVIEYDASLPGYKGRRVVCFRRLDTRGAAKPKAPSEPPEGNTSESSTTVRFHGSTVAMSRAFRP